MDLGIKGRFALVTGGSHGIGRSIALALARESCNVAICARNSPRPDYEGMVEATVAELKALGVKSIGISADMLVEGDIDRVASAVIDEWGTIDILVNNVGGGGSWGDSVVEATDKLVWSEVYDKNAVAATRFTMWAIPFMRRQKWGRVVTITSIYGREGGGRPWFNMAKAAQTSLMKTLALTHELARDGITFNSVAPGGVYIPGTGWEALKENDPEALEEMLDRDYPLGRLGTPEEVASVVAFLCSEPASLLSGSALAVDGGQSRSF
jgi:3-oxoacyl-[acyl-carrier protein] reductase